MMVLFGTDGFDDNARIRIENTYSKLKSAQKLTERLASVGLVDFFLISVVCSRLYGLDRKVPLARSGHSALGRLTEYHKLQLELLGEVDSDTQLLKANIASSKGTAAAIEEILVHCSETMMKIVYSSCENVLGLLNLIPDKPVNVIDLIEGSLDKAYVKKNALTRPRPPQD